MKRTLCTCIGLLLKFLMVQNGWACSCIPLSPKQSFESSDAVFAGNVIQTTRDSLFIAVELEVSEVWKGENTTSLTIETGLHSCGYSFEVNQSYLIYASKVSDNVFRTGLCSLTKPLQQADRDMTGWTHVEKVQDADFDQNKRVDFVDFLHFVNAYHTSNIVYDLDFNGRVNSEDFAIFLRWFGQTYE